MGITTLAPARMPRRRPPDANEAIAVVLGIKACGSANLKMAYRRAVNSTDPAGKRPSGVS